MSNALEVTNLCKSYVDFMLDNVSFSVPTGAIMGFVGQNGAGKTTTIKAILSLTHFDSGEVRIFGKKMLETDTRQGVGVVSDISPYDIRWKVSDVERIASMFYDDWEAKKFDSLLKQFGIGKNKKVGELSKGMGIKLMCAVAMSHNTKLLILDEPTSGLDPVARDELNNIFLEYVRDGNRSILFSTHITSDLEKVADYITCICGGRILFSDSKDKIMETYATDKHTTLEDIIINFSRRNEHE